VTRGRKWFEIVTVAWALLLLVLGAIHLSADIAEAYDCTAICDFACGMGGEDCVDADGDGCGSCEWRCGDGGGGRGARCY
jgi:hypothetical protein